MRALLFVCALALGACASEPDPPPAPPGAEPAAAVPAPPLADEGDCAEAGPYRVCRHEASGEAAIVVSRGGGETARWPAATGIQAGPFRAHPADLDGDGGADLLVATQTAVSNGLGVAYWTLDVLPDGAMAPAYSFQVEDLGAFETHLGAAGASGLAFWATDWVSAPDPTGRRDEGMYFVGRPVALASDGLSPTAAPLRARRLLDSFDREDPAGPAGLFAAPEAVTFDADPALGGCETTDEEVRVQAVRDSTDGYGGAYHVLALADGREASYLQGSPADGDLHVTHLGDAASGRLYPAEYAPADLAGRLRGGPMRLTTCASGEWARARVLWM